MAETFLCWKCGETLSGIILPMSRREECPACTTDQHVCKMCVFYDTRHRGQCNEERAESISDAERANFCDYFKPSTDGFKTALSMTSEAAKAKFVALFVDQSSDKAANVNCSADAQQSSAQKDKPPLSAKERAEQKLRDLLGG